jgi:integrase
MKNDFEPWNKGLAVGQKKPFTQTKTLIIANRLDDDKHKRDLALFTLGISTMLRSIDLLNLKVRNVIDSRHLIMDRFAVMQHKTRRPVVVQADAFTQRALMQWIDSTDKSEDDYLFTGLTRVTRDKPISRSHFCTLIKGWARSIGLDSQHYSSHSIRRSRAVLLYQSLRDPEVLRILLGQSSISATSAYLGISTDMALMKAEEQPLFQSLLPVPQPKK